MIKIPGKIRVSEKIVFDIPKEFKKQETQIREDIRKAMMEAADRFIEDNLYEDSAYIASIR